MVVGLLGILKADGARLDPLFEFDQTRLFDADDSDNWPGHQVILYHDETVMFRGNVVGGIRVRAVKKTAAAPPQAEGPNDPIPGWDDEEAVA